MADGKELARRVLQDVYAGANVDAADEIYAADFVDHDPGAPEEMRHGPEGVKKQAAMYQSAFEGLQLTIEDQVEQGDKVVTRWTARGTHKGELMGVPPSGNQVTITGITIARVADDRIQEEWSNWDGIGMLEQIGALSGG